MSEDEWANIGQAVRARRTHLGVTQKDAAHTAGVSDTTWLKLEAGQPVGELTLRKAAWPLRWTPAWVEELRAGRTPAEEQQETDAVAMNDHGHRLDAIEKRLGAIEQMIVEAIRGERQAPE